MEALDLDLATCEHDARRQHAADQRRGRLLGVLALEKKRLDDLARWLRIEEKEVKRLEGVSLSAFVANLRGNRDERLKAERKEYAAAKLRYDECAAVVESLRTQAAEAERELDELRGAESRYEAALAARERQVLASDTAERRRVAVVALEIRAERARIHELNEAATVANAAIEALEAVDGFLESAASWGERDLWGGLNLISIGIKHGYMGDARDAALKAQQLLERLNIELADVGMHAGAPEVYLGEFRSFADYLPTGFWTYRDVQKTVEEARQGVAHLIRQVGPIPARLYVASVRAAQRLGELENARREVLRPARAEGN